VKLRFRGGRNQSVGRARPASATGASSGVMGISGDDSTDETDESRECLLPLSDRASISAVGSSRVRGV